MSDQRTFRFCDYYDAHLFAHQLECEGHRATVFDFAYGMGSWSTPEFRVIAFEEGLAEGEEGVMFGEFQVGSAGRAIDDLLRLVAAATMWSVLPLGIYLASKGDFIIPQPTLTLVVVSFSAALLLLFGMVASVVAYHAFRRGERWVILVMRILGWLAIGVYNLGMPA